MQPLSPQSFDGPIVPCPAPLLSDAQRALVLATREAERALESLRRRALEVGEDAFACDVDRAAMVVEAARLELGKGT